VQDGKILMDFVNRRRKMSTTLIPEPPATEETDREIKFEHPSHRRLVMAGGYFGGGRCLVFDEHGFMPGGLHATAAYGAYWLGTRHLNAWNILLNGKPLRLLRVSDSQGFAARYWYTNSAVHGKPGEPDVVPEQSIRILRDVVISGGGIYERIELQNNGMKPASLRLDVLFAADFVDMFEVRGHVRQKRGKYLPCEIEGNTVTMGYRGLDQRVMQTRLSFKSPLPLTVMKNHARLEVTLESHQQVVLEVAITTLLEDCPISEPHPEPFDTFNLAKLSAFEAFNDWAEQGAQVTVDDFHRNAVLQQAMCDIYCLRIPTPYGPYIAAGIPWFYDPFGRDAIWVALQMLAFMPNLAREILIVNCGYQGTSINDWTLEDIGNIVHEVRFGEMARLQEIPYFRYYGTVDATPLFIVLFCQYVQWTQDFAFARKYWRHLRLALQYVNKKAGRGYLAYGQEQPPEDKPAGLDNRDWKDSGDAIVKSDGELATPPIATCNVQGYLVEAWESAAKLAEQLGYHRLSRTLTGKAGRLKKSFPRDYWMPGKRFIALALDGKGNQCDVIASNAGQLLRTGILDDDLSRLVSQRMQQPDMFNGWAVKTLAEGELRHNPDAYQLGSIWWHDNGIICDGAIEVGEVAFAHKILKGAFDAAIATMEKRLKELDSGTDRRESPEGLVPYPVACDPQAWAAGSIFMMLSAVLGLNRRRAEHRQGILHVVRPELPGWLPLVWVSQLQAAGGRATLHFSTMSNGSTGCSIRRWESTLRVLVEP
jgi:glycogen debranching enzyme